MTRIDFLRERSTEKSEIRDLMFEWASDINGNVRRILWHARGQRIIEVSCVREDAAPFLLPGIRIIYLRVISGADIISLETGDTFYREKTLEFALHSQEHIRLLLAAESTLFAL